MTQENFINTINDEAEVVKKHITEMQEALEYNFVHRQTMLNLEYALNNIARNVTTAHDIEIPTILEQNKYEQCECGTRMTVVPGLSELRCDMCGRIEKIIGAVFNDNQFYPQDGQKTKHGGYETSRHYRFWMERLQAQESKAFTAEEKSKIEYVIDRDGYERHELTCEIMREILKDPKVASTHLNDHAPLLVKTFGGRPPPVLDFQENRLCAIRFNKIMKLYDVVNPEGGNKPYYPYFIYKIIETMFENNLEMLRLLDYIHLQSRETVIKNDKFYEQIALLANDIGIYYIPTDPAGRL